MTASEQTRAEQLPIKHNPVTIYGRAREAEGIPVKA